MKCWGSLSSGTVGLALGESGVGGATCGLALRRAHWKPWNGDGRHWYDEGSEGMAHNLAHSG